MTGLELSAAKIGATALFGLVAYLFLLRRLADAVQPYRLKMAVLGESMLASDLTDEARKQVEFYLDNAFGGRIALVAAIAFPVAVVLGFYEELWGTTEPAPSVDERKMATFFSLSVFASNPFMGTVLGIEIFVFGLLLVVVLGPSALTAALMALMALMKAEGIVPAYRQKFA